MANISITIEAANIGMSCEIPEVVCVRQVRSTISAVAVESFVSAVCTQSFIRGPPVVIFDYFKELLARGVESPRAFFVPTIKEIGMNKLLALFLLFIGIGSSSAIAGDFGQVSRTADNSIIWRVPGGYCYAFNLDQIKACVPETWSETTSVFLGCMQFRDLSASETAKCNDTAVVSEIPLPPADPYLWTVHNNTPNDPYTNDRPAYTYIDGVKKKNNYRRAPYGMSCGGVPFYQTTTLQYRYLWALTEDSTGEQILSPYYDETGLNQLIAICVKRK